VTAQGSTDTWQHVIITRVPRKPQMQQATQQASHAQTIKQLHLERYCTASVAPAPLHPPWMHRICSIHACQQPELTVAAALLPPPTDAPALLPAPAAAVPLPLL
jgi:hypothetical protein